jgi:hypothetical protein
MWHSGEVEQRIFDLIMSATFMPENIPGDQAADNLFQYILGHLAKINSGHLWQRCNKRIKKYSLSVVLLQILISFQLVVSV